MKRKRFARVVQALERVADSRGTPEELIIDNGPEFIGKALDAWAWARRKLSSRMRQSASEICESPS